jgi:large subunit ribosomal protein L18e
MQKLKKSNVNLQKMITNLKMESNKNKTAIWRDIAKRLEKPNKNWAEVNISHLNRYVNKNETIVIPGKLLGAGYIEIPITVAAYSYSASAREKIVNAGGKILSFEELLKKNPKGTGIRIFSK